MKKAMKSMMVVAVLATIIFTILYRTIENGVMLSLAITAGTISYHFVIRYVVAGIFNSVMQNRADLSKTWYQQRTWEEKLYKKLHVKKWKSKMPTEVIVIFSFLPLLTVPAFGAFWVFLITSVLSAMIDLSFAIMQRYNRPRIMKLCKRRKKN